MKLLTKIRRLCFYVEEAYIRFCQKHFNHIGIYGSTDLYRLIGFAEDDDDFYYLMMDFSGQVLWGSMVGEFISLKGRLSKRDYECIDNTFDLNDCPKAEKFRYEGAP